MPRFKLKPCPFCGSTADFAPYPDRESAERDIETGTLDGAEPFRALVVQAVPVRGVGA